MERRQFLKTLITGAVGHRLCPYISISGFAGLSGCGSSNDSGNENTEPELNLNESYSPELLLRYFDFSVYGERNVWISRYGRTSAREIVLEARNEFEALIPEIPYLGRKISGITELPLDPDVNSYKFLSLFGSYLDLARYKALKKRSMSLEEITGLLYEAHQESYSTLSLEYRQLYNANWFNQENWDIEYAIQQNHTYEFDWVITPVPGDGVEFDFGFDVTECGPTQFFPSQGAEEFVASICPLDDLLSDACGLGLVRTKLISKGDDRCDFRFKQQSVY